MLWIHGHVHESQASKSTRKFDVLTWRQFAFYYNKSLEKRISKTHFTFQKETTVEPGDGHLGGMPWCLHHRYPNGRIDWALRKNVPDTCCIDIKTKADKLKRKKGRKNDCGEKPRK